VFGRRRKEKKTQQKAVETLPVDVPAGRQQWLREPYVMLALLIGTSLIVFRGYLFLEKAYLFKDIGSDSINVFYPQMMHIVDYLRTTGLPMWSFNQGMGQNIFPFGTADIFIPVFYLFGRNRLPFVIAFVEVMKIVIGGFFFYLYLRKLKLTSFATLTGGVLFAFSGYMILGGQWYIFSYDAMCCAILLFAFECFFQDKIWWILPIPIALLGAYQPFWLYLCGFFLFVYCTVRYIEERDWSLGAYVSLVAQTAGLAFAGVALSSIFLFEGVVAVVNSPRVGGEASYFKTLSSKPIFDIGPPIELSSVALRLFSSDLQGTGSNFSGWANYLESPLLYCGLITLLAIPQCVVAAEGKKRRLYLALLGLAVLGLVCPYFRRAFWGFSGDYYRTFSFFIALLFLYLGMRGLSHVDRTSKANALTMAISLTAVLGLLYLPSYDNYTNVDTDLLHLVTVLLVAYAGLMTFGTSQTRRTTRWIALAVICAEVAFLSNITVNHRPVITADELSSRVGFNDYAVDAVKYVTETDSGFFRIDKTYGSGPAIHESINDAKIQQYYGSPSYFSFNQINYIKFLSNVDAIHGDNETETRWAVGIRGRPVLQILSSVKYGLSKDPNAYSQISGYEPLKIFQDVYLFKNRNFLPLGFGYDAYFPASAFARLDSASKDRVLSKAVIIDDGQLPNYSQLKRLDTTVFPPDFTVQELETDVARLRGTTMQMTDHGQNLIRGIIKLDSPKILFFSIPYDKGWSATVDGRPSDLQVVDFGMTGLLLDGGQHQIELKFRPPLLTVGEIVSVVALIIYLGALCAPRLRRFRSQDFTFKTSAENPKASAENLKFSAKAEIETFR
jgi:hypothetical protein